MARTCLDCPKTISARSKGRCQICTLRANNRDAAFVARRTEANRKRNEDPAERARHAEACRQAKLRAMQDPATLERMREAGRTIGTKNFWHVRTPEGRAAARIAIKRKALAWCPEEFWDLNRQLKLKGLLLAERKETILQMVEGTAEHARLQIARNEFKQQLREARRQQEAY